LAPPDPHLLPDLSQALGFGAKALNLNSYDRDPITDNLARVAASCWSYQPQAFLALNGGIEAVYTVLRTLVMPGTMVAIENPTATRLLDILEGLGANIVPVACDNDGPIPSSLKSALHNGAAIFLFQPRTNTTTGHVVPPARLSALADELKNHQTLIIEDDGLGDLSAGASASIGRWLPSRTVHIVSYSKSLGPDLRVAVLSCTREIAQQIRSYRNFGASWTSRILQDAVAWLIEDKATQDLIAEARLIYQKRRTCLVDELVARGVEVSGVDGLSVWIRVPDEQTAMVNMALCGFPVLPGGQFSFNLPDHYIRVATSKLSGHYEEIAEAIRTCVNLGSGREGRRF
jgi:DNA-binding transcriptional MocR family regulator